MATKNAIPGMNGDLYIPYEQRSGKKSVVYFTRDLSPDGLRKIYDRISGVLTGKVAIKLHTGEAEGPNIIPRPWVRALHTDRLPEASIIETNTYYEGSRYTTEAHRETLKINGWNFCPVDIMDEDGAAILPVTDGKWFTEMHVGKNLLNYDSMLALTHFKGHTKGGFGGSNKNIGIGCADGRIGKKEIHTTPGSEDMWDISNEEFMERMTESTKATIDHFAGRVAFINVMRNMSVSCDCEGCMAEPVVTPDVGILASLDILAVDNACMDVIYDLPGGGGRAMIERVETRHGLRQLSYMKELGMGNDRYTLIDIDHEDAIVTAEEITKDIEPQWRPDYFNTFVGRNGETATAETPAEKSSPKRVLIVSSSLRAGSNSELLARECEKGAKTAGHEVEFVSLKGKDIRFCIGCLACQKSGSCVLKDDVPEIMEKVKRAEVIVFATPIYYYEMSGQLKTLLDRLNPLYPTDYAFREIYMIATAAEDEPTTFDKAYNGLLGWVDCFEEAELKGIVTGGGIDGANSAPDHADAMAKAYKLGFEL